MVSDAGYDRIYADLVSGLLDARSDPATARFDDELNAAVEAGAVTAETARRLRFWQRASLRLLADHTRAVLPAALGALDASREEAEAYVEQLLHVVRDEAPVEQEAPHEADRERSAEPPPPPGPPPPVRRRDTPEPASTAGPPAPSSLEERRRLIVAELVSAAPDIRTDTR